MWLARESDGPGGSGGLWVQERRLGTGSEGVQVGAAQDGGNGCKAFQARFLDNSGWAQDAASRFCYCWLSAGRRTMRRREFITLIGGAAAWPLIARAQQAAMPVIGFLSGRSLVSDANLVAAFRQGLGEGGYLDAQNVTIDFRWADGQLDRLPALAAELIERKVAVIFAGASDVAAGALRVAAATVPVVVATGSDPVASGLVASLNRPGGNLTGVTVITAALWPKRLELLRDLISPTHLIALLVNPNNLTATPATRELSAAARLIGQGVIVLTAGTEAEFDTAFAALVERRANALVVADDALFANRREALVALAARHAVPAIYGRREYPAAGGLISYGASTADQYYQSGVYVARILKGARPADLPFLQPTKFELGHQPKDRKGARPRSPADPARPRRRGDRIEMPLAAVHESVPGVRRDKAALSSGCKPHPATAPAGSNRSSHGGNEVAEAFG